MNKPVRYTGDEVEYAKLRQQFRRRVRGDKRLTPNTKNVLQALLDWLNKENGYAWRSQEDLVEECGVTLRTVKTAIKQGKEFGYIQVERVNRLKTNNYYFFLPADSVNPVEVQPTGIEGLSEALGDKTAMKEVEGKWNWWNRNKGLNWPFDTFLDAITESIPDIQDERRRSWKAFLNTCVRGCFEDDLKDSDPAQYVVAAFYELIPNFEA